jgi:TetR/AcrR family transcriptional repressor of nem operon
MLAGHFFATLSDVAMGTRQSRPALTREFLDTAVTESVSDCQSRGCFFVNSSVELAPHDPEIAQLVLDNQRTLEAQLETVLRRGQTEGNIRSAHNATDLAQFVYNTLTGLKTTGKSNRDETTLRSVVTVTMATRTT